MEDHRRAQGQHQPPEHLRRGFDLKGVDDDTGGDHIQRHHRQHPAVLRLQQLGADQQPPKENTNKQLCDLFQQ